MRTLVASALLLAVSPLVAADGTIRYLPSDTKVVFTLQVGRLSESDREQGQTMLREVYKKHICPALAKTDALPLSDLEHIVVGLPYAGTINGVIVIRGKIDRKKFEQQMSRATKGRNVTSKRLGTPPVTVYYCKLDEKVMLEAIPGLAKIPPLVRPLVVPRGIYISAFDDSTLFVSLSGLPAMTNALRARAAKSEVRVSDELGKLLRVAYKEDTVTVILMEDSLHPGLHLIADEATRETFDQFEHVRFHIRGGKTTEIETVVKGKSSDLAPTLETKSKRVLEVIRELLPTVMPDATRREVIDTLVKSFRVVRKDSQVTITGSMSEADAKKFIVGGKK